MLLQHLVHGWQILVINYNFMPNQNNTQKLKTNTKKKIDVSLLSLTLILAATAGVVLGSILAGIVIATLPVEIQEHMAIISPTEVMRGETKNFTLTFTVGTEGVSPGGGIKLGFPNWDTFNGVAANIDWSVPQRVTSNDPGFIEVGASIRGSNIFRITDFIISGPKDGQEPFNNHNKNVRELIIVNTSNYTLQTGDKIYIRYKNAKAQLFPQDVEFTISVMASETSNYVRVAESPRILVKGQAASKIRAIAPSIIRKNEQFNLKLAAVDNDGFRANNFTGEVTISANGTFLRNYVFTPEDFSVALVSGLEFTTTGVKEISVTGLGISGLSNPIVVTDNIQDNIYWGDVHWHTRVSDGVRTPEEGYLYAKEVAGLDFSAMTDHDFGIFAQGYEQDVKDYANMNNISGEFVVFSAYEWTNPTYDPKPDDGIADGGGHKNIYYPEDQAFYNSNNPLYGNPTLLWDTLDLLSVDNDPITIPHHPASGEGGTDWNMLWEYPKNNPLQPLVELFSTHGQFEYRGNPLGVHEEGVFDEGFIQYGLSQGHIFGFLASSDDHYSFPGNVDWDTTNEGGPTYFAEGHGLMAVKASDLSRDSLFTNMKLRRTYATTGRRIVISFEMDDHEMGEMYSTATGPSISINVMSPSEISKIEVIRGNDQDISLEPLPSIYTAEPNTKVFTHAFTDDEFTGLTSDSTYHYYLRVTLEESLVMSAGTGNQMGWSSPIWVTKE